MMSIVSSMALLHLVNQTDQNETLHDFFGRVIPMVPASESHDATGIINTPSANFWSR